MKLETTPRDDHQVKIVAELDSETLESFKHKAARKISQQSKIPGFRPGKAPYDIVRRMYGDEALNEQAVELLVDDIYPKVIDESQIKPSGPGALEEVISMDPPKFAFIIPLAPEVELNDYKTIKQDYSLEPVTDEEMDQFLRRMQSNYATAEPVERAAEKGDLVYVMLTGTFVNTAEDEETEAIKETPFQTVIGDDIMGNEWPFKDFGDRLIGLSANEERTFTYQYPEDADEEEFRGKEVEFKVVLQSVKHLALPELNDEFAQTVGEFETLEDLKHVIHHQLEDNKKADYDDQYYNDLLDKIAEQATVKFAPQMLEEEIEHSLQLLERNLSRQNMDLNTYLKLVNQDKDAYIETNLKPLAEKRLIHSLILDKIGELEKIELAQEDMNAAIYSSLQQIQSQPQPKKSKSNDQYLNSVAMNAVSQLYNQRILERLKAIATGTLEEEKQVEVEEAPIELTPSTDEVAVEKTPDKEIASTDETATENPVENPTSEPSSSDTAEVSENQI